MNNNTILAYGLESENLCKTYPDLRNDKPPNTKQVELCKQWIIENCEKRDTYYSHRDYTNNTRQFDSYNFKHIVEKDYGTYIANGAFIQAAVELGYDFKRQRNNDWDAVFKMGFKKDYPSKQLRQRLTSDDGGA